MEDAIAQAEQEQPGHVENELSVGDLVLRRRQPYQIYDAAGAGPSRFTRSVDRVVYRVVERVAAVANQPFAVR